MPKRIQRKRTKGWRMPEGAVYVGRPTKWGNPYQIGIKAFAPQSIETPHTRTDLVRLFRQHRFPVAVGPEIKELRGKDLACWCPLDQPCHADVLLEWANEEPPQ